VSGIRQADQINLATVLGSQKSTAEYDYMLNGSPVVRANYDNLDRPGNNIYSYAIYWEADRYLEYQLLDVGSNQPYERHSFGFENFKIPGLPMKLVFGIEDCTNRGCHLPFDAFTTGSWAEMQQIYYDDGCFR
jgi:hypothetical protein